MGSKPNNVLGVRCATHVFLIWRVRARENTIAHLSHPGLPNTVIYFALRITFSRLLSSKAVLLILIVR